MTEHPMQPVEDIAEIMFPCPQCETEGSFHVIGMRPYGVGIKIPFMRNPLATSHKAYFLVCTRCDTINARLEPSDVDKLRACSIPKSIHQRYPKVASFYTVEMLHIIEERFKDDPEMMEEWKRLIKAYRLEL